MSHLVTSKVMQARKQFDRPPREHEDLHWWTWQHLQNLSDRDMPWAPTSGPETMLEFLNTGPGQLPLPPPKCYDLGAYQWL